MEKWIFDDCCLIDDVVLLYGKRTTTLLLCCRKICWYFSFYIIFIPVIKSNLAVLGHGFTRQQSTKRHNDWAALDKFIESALHRLTLLPFAL